MFSLSSLLHLRIPFSFFLLPIFLFTLSFSPNITGKSLLWTFVIIHFFLYPASNAYNSYFDKDEKSIGILKNPPPVKKGLYPLALIFDSIALILGYVKINITFVFMLLIYGLVSKAYSHPAIRLKKYAIASWLVTGVFQGFFTVLMCYIGINKFSIENTVKPEVFFAGVLATLMLMANYPMTQIYQHEEDAKRGDLTLSYKLGIRKTFYVAAAFFMLAGGGFVFYFNVYFKTAYSWLFVLAITPVIIYFAYWFIKVSKDESKADYTHTLWLNVISAICLNVFFIYLFLDSTQILQAFQ